MAKNKIGKQSFYPENPVSICCWASVAGKKEQQGPMGHLFDRSFSDTRFGKQTWEQAEQHLQQLTLNTLLKKARLQKSEIDLAFSGDLLNQCIGSSFSLRKTGIPHLGLYGACSTMAESLLLGAITAGGGYADKIIAMTSSHFASSERQYRFPLGYGGQRTPTSQWTVTGCGAVLLQQAPGPVEITSATVGTVTDLGITDASNMGCAMAPAAFESIRAHFDDTHSGPEDFDLIATGDLGEIGKEVLLCLFRKEGIAMGGKLIDCGTMIYDQSDPQVHAGGSGCGCSALVLCSELLGKLKSGKLKKILFCGTGALLSPTSAQQKLPIPGVCHCICMQSRRLL